MFSFFIDSKIQKKDATEETTLNENEKAVCCRKCLNELTRKKFRVEVNNSSVHSFANPFGYIFTIICFSKAYGTISTGETSSEFSWFKGFSWIPCLCRGCMTHTGWKFISGDSKFTALIEDKII